MKAVVVHEPGKATLADIPEPSNISGETLLQPGIASTIFSLQRLHHALT
jgi:hypothetical protein